MLGALVAVVAVVVAAAWCKVDAARDLLIKQRILHREGDKGVDADGKLAYIARAFVDIELLVDADGIVGGGFDDLAVLEGELDVRIGEPVFKRRRVVGDGAVDAGLDGGGVDFAVRNIHAPRALDGGQTLDGEAQVGAGRDKANFVRALHQRLERIHGLVHLGVVECADVKIVILKRFGAHIGQLRHAGGGVA
ncbi:hypothetical protein SDC9_66544 [bioreactor metagenome]|uniref:Uncharacterized protein n=1 Tax=bioreactor metagenome TaxID=1076179 RepID=A0A644XVB4_9ZZZZ